MLVTAGMPGRFWGEAVMTAVYLLNRSPIRSLDGMTSYVAWYNKRPAVHHFCVFGCIAYMKVTCPHLAKLDPRGLKVVFIDYEPGSKAYRLYDPVGGQAHVSHDVVFNESTFLQWNDVIEADHNPNQFTVEYLVTEPEEEGARHQEPSPPPAGAPPELVEFATPRTADSTLDADHDANLEARYWRMDDLVGGGEPPGLVARELEEVAELHAISADEPNTLAEAERNLCWLKAMQEEMTSITENQTWSLEDMPSGHRAIGIKWVFKLKHNEKGEVVKHKARLVAKGYVQ